MKKILPAIIQILIAGGLITGAFFYSIFVGILTTIIIGLIALIVWILSYIGGWSA